MTTLAPSARTPATVAGILDLTVDVLQRRYKELLAPYLLVSLSIGAVLLLGGAMAPDITPLLVVAALTALVGVAVSFAAASIAAHRIAGALLVGDPDRHLDGTPVGGTLHEVGAAHERVLPLLGLGVVLTVSLGVGILSLFGLARASIWLLLPAVPAFYYVSVRLSLATPVVIMGENDPLRAMARSWQLTEGHFWTLIGVSVALGVASGIVGGLASFGGAVLGETVQGLLDLALSVLWLPVGPASTMALWVILRQRAEPEPRTWRSRPARPSVPQPVRSRSRPSVPDAPQSGRRMVRRGDTWVLEGGASDDSASAGSTSEGSGGGSAPLA